MILTIALILITTMATLQGTISVHYGSNYVLYYDKLLLILVRQIPSLGMHTTGMLHYESTYTHSDGDNTVNWQTNLNGTVTTLIIIICSVFVFLFCTCAACFLMFKFNKRNNCTNNKFEKVFPKLHNSHNDMNKNNHGGYKRKGLGFG